MSVGCMHVLGSPPSHACYHNCCFVMQATDVAWKAMLCCTLFSLANFLKAAFTKLMSSHFYKTAHFFKVKEAIVKEYYLLMLSQPRPASKAEHTSLGVLPSLMGYSSYYTAAGGPAEHVAAGEAATTPQQQEAAGGLMGMHTACSFQCTHQSSPLLLHAGGQLMRTRSDGGDRGEAGRACVVVLADGHAADASDGSELRCAWLPCRAAPATARAAEPGHQVCQPATLQRQAAQQHATTRAFGQQRPRQGRCCAAPTTARQQGACASCPGPAGVWRRCWQPGGPGHGSRGEQHQQGATLG